MKTVRSIVFKTIWKCSSFWRFWNGFCQFLKKNIVNLGLLLAQIWDVRNREAVVFYELISGCIQFCRSFFCCRNIFCDSYPEIAGKWMLFRENFVRFKFKLIKTRFASDPCLAQDYHDFCNFLYFFCNCGPKNSNGWITRIAWNFFFSCFSWSFFRKE